MEMARPGLAAGNGGSSAGRLSAGNYESSGPSVKWQGAEQMSTAEICHTANCPHSTRSLYCSFHSQKSCNSLTSLRTFISLSPPAPHRLTVKVKSPWNIGAFRLLHNALHNGEISSLYELRRDGTRRKRPKECVARVNKRKREVSLNVRAGQSPPQEFSDVAYSSCLFRSRALIDSSRSYAMRHL